MVLTYVGLRVVSGARGSQIIMCMLNITKSKVLP